MPRAGLSRCRAYPQVTFDGTVTANVPRAHSSPRFVGVTVSGQRLFAAIFPPPEAADHLARAVGPLHGGEPGLRWAQREQWHVTLAFLPAVAPHEVDDLVRALDRVAAASPALRLVLAGAGAFPRADRARVVWAGIGGDVAGLHALADGCRAAAADRRLDVSRGAFRAHVTLARARRAPVRAGRLLDGLAAYEGPPWTAGALVVVRSHPGAGEAGRSRYEVCASLPLCA